MATYTRHQRLTEGRHNALWLVAGLLTAGALMFAAHWEADRQERVHMDAFSTRLSDMARISETIISENIKAIDDSLRVLRASYVADPKHFAENVLLLRSGPLADSELLVVLVDRDGYLAYTDTPNMNSRIYLGDRKYFRFFAEGGKDSLYIDEPSFGRVTKRYVLPMARPVYDKQGDFIGVIAISIKQQSLIDFGPTLQLSGDTAVTVVNRGGAVASRSRDLASVQGTKLLPEQLVPMLKGEEGIFSSRRAPDGVEQVIAYRHIRSLNSKLIVFVESSSENTLSAISLQRTVLMWGTAFTSLVIMVLIAIYLKGKKITVQLIDTLRRSKEQEYEALTQTSLDGFWIADTSGRILNTNATLCKMLGYTQEELAGLGIADVETAGSQEEVDAHISKIIETGSDRFESRFRRKDGTNIDVEVSTQYVDGPEGRIFVFVQDITERKKAEEVIHKSEYELRMLAEAMPQIVWITRPDGWNIFFNKQWVDFTGQTMEESYGHGWIKPFHPDDRQRAWDAWQSATSNGSIYSLECRLRRVDGVYRWWLVRGVPLLDEQGAIQKWVGTCTDIDEFKKAEEERLTLERQLQQSQKLESLGVLAGGIAHDFNNILAIIIGHCSLAKVHADIAENSISEIEKAAERAAELCRQMLAYAGKSTFTLSQVNMTALVDDMAKMLKSSIRQNTAIKLVLSPDIPAFKGDVSQLRQVVMNLIINASEAIGELQGEVKVSLAKTEIGTKQQEMDYLCQAITPGWYACLEVADTGCGMNDETRRRLFEPFYTTKFTGRGLGMSAVLGIVMAHKGALQLFSQPDQGTTFKVYLPIQAGDSAGDEDIKPFTPAAAWQGSGKILLVEDEDQVRLIAKTLLEKMGFEVIEAVNGKEAVELYLKNAVDITLVVTDMGMPVMDGYRMFLELKKINPELPIIISSGFGDAEVGSRIARDEIAGLVNKPYNYDQLREVLKSVVDGAHTRS